MLKVGVVGAGGRMGQEVCRTVMAAPDLELVAAVDPSQIGLEVEGQTVSGDVEALTASGGSPAAGRSAGLGIRISWTRLR